MTSTSSFDPFRDRLNEYLDSEIDPRERRRLEVHLKECEACRQALTDLRDIVRTASELSAIEPPPRVWDSIARAIGERRVASEVGSPPLASPELGSRAKSRRAGLYPTLAVAAALLLGVAVWAVLRPAAAPPPRPTDSLALANMVTDELRAAEAHYDKAIDGLEQIIAQNGGVLPPDLAAVLNQNLDLIEGAIAESRTAMSTEPDSAVAQESLLEALRKKVSLLQNTILLINEIRKGQGENALDLIDEMRKTSSPNPI